MTGSFSDYAELKILEHAVGKTAWTMPAVVAIALVTTVPTDASIGSTLVEPTQAGGTLYVRKTLTPSTDFGSAAAGQIQNAAVITFATAAGAGWGSIVGFALCDSATYNAGNVIAWGSLGAKTIAAGDTASFAINDITITLD